MTGHLRGDARKRADEQHYTHHDPAVRALIAEAERRGAVEALRSAADRWTQGEWSDVMLPKPTPPAVPVIAYSNRVGDWLRARAEAVQP